ncbi:hypothetical protein F53441_12907 [Fusarium austroafricanum]|uniref:Uncharacterized protein n=1 Tax=Fusarium austroafricanum TaxID=2364996 RepID=A0A8H4JT85_9HYPO|nr:hypothetical protein F53441_12907 [Fusarium austroafricanum]
MSGPSLIEPDNNYLPAIHPRTIQSLEKVQAELKDLIERVHAVRLASDIVEEALDARNQARTMGSHVNDSVEYLASEEKREDLNAAFHDLGDLAQDFMREASRACQRLFIDLQAKSS